MVEDEDAGCACEDCGSEAVIRPWNWVRFGATVANLGGNLTKAVWAFLDDQKDALMAHVAVGDEQRDAWKSMHRDLESLPTTTDKR